MMLFKKNYLEVAKIAALKAGRLLMASYGKLKYYEIQMKSKNDFVTELDKKSERLIIAEIRKNFPDHSIQAEEGGGGSQRDGILWIIDPLDGTSNYIHRLPMFAVSIGVACEGMPVAGVVYDPVHDEMFTAERSHGAFLNGKRIAVSSTDFLKDALMVTGIPFRARDRFTQYMESFTRISMASAGMRRSGSAALDLAYVAAGRLDGFWELDLSPWDIAAGALLVLEGGGNITDVCGTGDYLKKGDLVASNGKVHGEILAITSEVFGSTDRKAAP